ncbi:glycosyltransferase family 87 protein [Actibacterium pelagium]|uniref:DUF2029 domain-containing protein n=1 Tax=Actibacterium pelagium TaxID=2029103 RepID=A0A917ABN4_9RHOB|nr:glycosyltransferase family 87 protein [Actibacterium pelagium]GGE41624.1 hypothetical protein GCM10011517_06550 [Actibacterium pelagium]
MTLPNQTPGDLRLSNFAARWRVPFGILFTAAMVGAAFIFVFTISQYPRGEGCRDVLVDFCVFWSAAKLAMDGQVMSVFSQDLIAQFGTMESAGWAPWLHPAATLLALYPIGAMEMQIAWALFTGLSVLAMLIAARPFTAPHTPIWTSFALAPAVMPALIIGQFTMLWMAGLLAALWQLREGRKVAAGVLIGLLTLKPTLGILIPVALLAAKEWKVIIFASATTIGINIVASLLFGFSYWPELLNTYAEHKDWLLVELSGLQQMGSPAALLASLGVTSDTAVLLQGLLLPILALWVFWVWRQDIEFDRKAALLCAALPLSTPYLWHYDAGLVLLSGLFLLRAGQLDRSVLGVIALCLLCFGPGLRTWMSLLTPWDVPHSAWITVPMMSLALLLCLRPVRSTPQQPLERTT